MSRKIPSDISMDLHLDRLQKDFFYKKIIKTKAFERLKKISFLGAIDYVMNPYSSRADRSRYTHSLNVGALALYVSDRRGYPKDLERLIVSSALLHDIGHLPLSHSIEKAIKKMHGVDHHILGLRIIGGEISIGKELHKLLKSTIDFDALCSILNGSSSEKYSDIFYSPINIDTIDGVLRTATYFSLGAPIFRQQLADAAFGREFSDINERQLDKFWQLKDIVYRSFINGDMGVKADFIRSFAFENLVTNFSASDLITDEHIWRDKYKVIFETLSGRGALPDISFCEIKTEIIKRRYFTNTNDSGEKKYMCEKTKSEKEISFFHIEDDFDQKTFCFA